MTYSLIEVDWNNRKAVKKWVTFPYNFYRGDKYYIPQLIPDELDFFSPKNPVYQVAKQKLFLVQEGEKTVGRIAAIIHSLEEKKLGYRRGRFGWIEMIDNFEVTKLLLDACQNWFRSESCKEMTGPHGFTDLDPEGLLIEGFNELPTIAASYNPPYYAGLIEKYGLTKQADYIEFRVKVPAEEPKYLTRVVKTLKENSQYRPITCKSKKELLKYVPQFWVALEETFAHLYGVTPLTPAQQDYYTKKYFGLLDPKYVHFVLDQKDEMVAFFITMPNLSEAFQKAKGHILPFGFIHLLKGMRRPDVVDFLLAGVKPSVPNSPMITALMSLNVFKMLRENGIKYIETNHELEDNTAVTKLWSRFESRMHRRTRLYKLPL